MQMKEVVIITNKAEADNTLITLIKTLFPECKIRVVIADEKGSGHLNTSPSILQPVLPVKED